VERGENLLNAIRNRENEGVKRSQRILRWNETFLLVIEILDTVLLVNLREGRQAKRKREEKVKVSAGLKG
jgi:hypothetical protein